MSKSLVEKPAAGFERLAILSTISVYLLIFIGGLVRVSGAGLGCPDWPKCFGRWIPPLSISEIPQDIDPASFNLTLAWIEYFNRLTGVMVGFLVAGAAIMALIRLRQYPRLLYPTLLAAFLVAFQGWQGSVVVASELTPFIVTIHMLTALIIVSLLTFVSQEAYFLNRSLPGEKSVYPVSARLWVTALWIGGIAQVILGTQVRAAGETLLNNTPLLPAQTVLGTIGSVHQIHMFVGMALALMTVYVAIIILRLSQSPSNLVRQSVYGLIILVIAQIVMGLVMASQGLGPAMQLFHLWAAALYIGLALVLFSAMRRRQENLAESSRSFGRVLAFCLVIVMAMSLLSVGVVRQAEASRANIPTLYEVPYFEFVERSGATFGQTDFYGKLTVVDFFFTSCQSICPPMTAAMRELYTKYAHSDKVQFVSFTVDPGTDSVERLSQFALANGVVDNRWLFVRGEADEVRWLTGKGFFLNDELPVFHSSRFVLVDDQAVIRGYYDSSDKESLKLLERHILTLSKDAG